MFRSIGRWRSSGMMRSALAFQGGSVALHQKISQTQWQSVWVVGSVALHQKVSHTQWQSAWVIGQEDICSVWGLRLSLRASWRRCEPSLRQSRQNCAERKWWKRTASQNLLSYFTELILQLCAFEFIGAAFLHVPCPGSSLQSGPVLAWKLFHTFNFRLFFSCVQQQVDNSVCMIQCKFCLCIILVCGTKACLCTTLWGGVFTPFSLWFPNLKVEIPLLNALAHLNHRFDVFDLSSLPRQALCSSSSLEQWFEDHLKKLFE